LRTNLDNVEHTLDDTLAKVEVTTTTVQDGVITPVKQLSALIHGLTVGFGFLFKGGRTVHRATHDEEMFI
jgi:hypothetical protein